MPSGRAFEAAGGSVVLIICPIICFEDIESLYTLVVKCGNTQKSVNLSSWQTCKVLSPWVLIRETTVNLSTLADFRSFIKFVFGRWFLLYTIQGT